MEKLPLKTPIKTRIGRKKLKMAPIYDGKVIRIFNNKKESEIFMTQFT